MTTGTESGHVVTAHLQGVPLDDDRWEDYASRVHTHRAGVWELLTGTEMLPRYPGARLTSWEVPGGQGSRRARHMPVQARTIPLRIRFWPICTDPANPMYQREGRDVQERMGFLAQNMRQFIWRVQAGRAMSGGNLKLSRTLSAGEHFVGNGKSTGGVESCVGAFEADWDQDIPRGARSATLTALFRNLGGTWYTEWQYVRATGLRANRDYRMEVPMGDAPVEDCMVAVNPTGSAGGHRFTNDVGPEPGVGFTTGPLTPNRWSIFDCAGDKWVMGSAPSRWWSTPKPNRGAMRALGVPMGSALLILPGVADDGRRVGIVNIRLSTPGEVNVALRPKWF